MADVAVELYHSLQQTFEGVNQGHVFSFWSKLVPDERRQLLEDLSLINVPALPELSRIATSRYSAGVAAADILPPEVVPRESVDRDVIDQGRALLSRGKAAAFTVAGGQGTRLGFDGPKGAFVISPVRDKPLFQLFAENIAATDRRYGCRTRWYIMTSPANDEATRSFFEQNKYFGLRPDAVAFFQQGVMPAFSRDGKVLLAEKHRLALSPDGHGGSLLALARSGMLADMAERGIEYISYFQVDNPLVACLDPAFIGLHAARGSEMSSKSLPKADDYEKVGVFAISQGRLTVIEYSDFPQELAVARNPDGSRRFDAGNIAIHLLSRSFVERLTADAASFALPWHRANKKMPCVDLKTGAGIEPAEPNAIKLESFVFDALPLARNPIVMETSRAEEFSPVKNATGVDSVDTARRDMNRRAARWLEAAGFSVPRTPAGEPDGLFEISPLAALDCDQLREGQRGGRKLERGSKFYLE
jgi:UDP-N-acetylglucosamine/UDP-N-acetylgalactosamine diphosphorylase